MTAEPAAQAAPPDAVATDGDPAPGRNPVVLVFRHVLQERLAALFQRGDRVLDLGCGTGEDALFLASRGVSVVGLDPSPALIARARHEAAVRGHGGRCRFEVLEAEELGAAGAGFDGAYSGSGTLNRADLPTVGTALAAALRPGAAVLLSLLGPWPLPGLLRRALTGVGEPRRARAAFLGRTSALASYPTLGETRRALGPMFAWADACALGVMLPGPEHERWAAEHAQAFGLLAALERAVRRWPLLRQLGDRVVLEGRRVGSR